MVTSVAFLRFGALAVWGSRLNRSAVLARAPYQPPENVQGTLILRASLAFLEWLDQHVYSAGEAGGIRRRVLQPHHGAAPRAGNRNGGVANDNAFDVRVTTQQTPFDQARRHTRAGASRTPLVLALIPT